MFLKCYRGYRLIASQLLRDINNPNHLNTVNQAKVPLNSSQTQNSTPSTPSTQLFNIVSYAELKYQLYH